VKVKEIQFRVTSLNYIQMFMKVLVVSSVRQSTLIMQSFFFF